MDRWDGSVAMVEGGGCIRLRRFRSVIRFWRRGVGIGISIVRCISSVQRPWIRRICRGQEGGFRRWDGEGREGGGWRGVKGGLWSKTMFCFRVLSTKVVGHCRKKWRLPNSMILRLSLIPRSRHPRPYPPRPHRQIPEFPHPPTNRSLDAWHRRYERRGLRPLYFEVRRKWLFPNRN